DVSTRPRSRSIRQLAVSDCSKQNKRLAPRSQTPLAVGMFSRFAQRCERSAAPRASLGRSRNDRRGLESTQKKTFQVQHEGAANAADGGVACQEGCAGAGIARGTGLVSVPSGVKGTESHWLSLNKQPALPRPRQCSFGKNGKKQKSRAR